MLSIFSAGDTVRTRTECSATDERGKNYLVAAGSVGKVKSVDDDRLAVRFMTYSLASFRLWVDASNCYVIAGKHYVSENKQE